MKLLFFLSFFLTGCLFVEEDVGYYHPRAGYYSPGPSYAPRYYAPGQYGVGVGVAPRYRAQGYYDDDRRYVRPRRYYYDD